MEKVDNLTQSIDDYMTGDKATPEQVQELAEEVTNVFWRKSTVYNFLYASSAYLRKEICVIVVSVVLSHYFANTTTTTTTTTT